MIRIAAARKTFTSQQRKEWAAARKVEVAQLCERLEKKIDSLRDTDMYRRYLTAMGQFHEYSYRNTALIVEQMPEATMVAGIKVWNKLGRSVKKGEHGIRILAPMIRTGRRNIPQMDPVTGLQKQDPDGTLICEDREVYIPAYKVVSVFDISQTEGEPLPEVVSELKGDVEGYDRLYNAIVQAAGVRVAIGPTNNNACGMADTSMQIVTLREGMSEKQNIKTLLHEAAHCRLHPPGNQLTREMREVQAESVAFVVAAHFGLDTSDYSIGYVEGWGTGEGNPELKASLDIISRHASTLIGEIEHELAMDRDRSMETPQQPAARKQPGWDR